MRKRHYNKELWSAPLEQLGGYAADAGADGFGIYLVFWFGIEFPVPGRSDRDAVPSTAEALETMLRNDIPAGLQDKLAIVVLDVSRPTKMVTGKIRRPQKRSKKQDGR
ncbi:hypothetical protein [Mesorhizobium salmacidum]|uniref:AMP-binding enzyme C-terminal domain-containing protein n=1 Tax=Mesorhizobium salmacidum TaxID=3015171 RepID=A0ABU8L4C9_9HYPH